MTTPSAIFLASLVAAIVLAAVRINSRLPEQPVVTDAQWVDWCYTPSRFERKCFWCGIAFMCACTLAVLIGGPAYLLGYFS